MIDVLPASAGKGVQEKVLVKGLGWLPPGKNVAPAGRLIVPTVMGVTWFCVPVTIVVMFIPTSVVNWPPPVQAGGGTLTISMIRSSAVLESCPACVDS